MKWPAIGAIFASTWFSSPVLMWFDSVHPWLAAGITVVYFLGALTATMTLAFGDWTIRIPFTKGHKDD